MGTFWRCCSEWRDSERLQWWKIFTISWIGWINSSHDSPKIPGEVFPHKTRKVCVGVGVKAQNISRPRPSHMHTKNSERGRSLPGEVQKTHRLLIFFAHPPNFVRNIVVAMLSKNDFWRTFRIRTARIHTFDLCLNSEPPRTRCQEFAEISRFRCANDRTCSYCVRNCFKMILAFVLNVFCSFGTFSSFEKLVFLPLKLENSTFSLPDRFSTKLG